MSINDVNIKTICSVVVWSRQDALNMKEKLELLIAMIELADNKISKTQDHDTANKMIDSFGLDLIDSFGLDIVLQYSRISQRRMNWQPYYKHTMRPVTKMKYLTSKSFFLRLWVWSGMMRRKPSLPSNQQG